MVAIRAAVALVLRLRLVPVPSAVHSLPLQQQPEPESAPTFASLYVTLPSRASLPSIALEWLTL